MKIWFPRLILFAFILVYRVAATIVYPRVFQERSLNGEIVVKVNDEITLHLQKASVVLSQMRLDVRTNGDMVHEVMNGSLLEEHLYSDPTVRASVMLYQQGDAVTLTGMVTENMRIKPVPVSARSLYLAGAHQLEVIDMKKVDDNSENRTELRIPASAFVESRAPETPQESIVYPEVYVGVDSNYAKDANTSLLLGYLVIFFNGINLKLAELRAPRVQLRLVGLMIGAAVDRSFTRTGPYVDADRAISDFFNYVNPGIGLPDIFFLLTGEDLIGMINGAPDPNLSGTRIMPQIDSIEKFSSELFSRMGLSPLGGMCIWRSNALISEDKYESFSGILVATHEFGHMLGAPHDVFPEYDNICGWKLGYAMSYLDGGERKHHFSPCSQYLIRLSLSQKLKTCLEFSFVQDYLAYLPGLYPGAVANGYNFCKAKHPNIPDIYFPEQSPYLLVQCRVMCNEPQGQYGGYRYYLHHALEGTPCYAAIPSYAGWSLMIVRVKLQKPRLWSKVLKPVAGMMYKRHHDRKLFMHIFVYAAVASTDNGQAVDSVASSIDLHRRRILSYFMVRMRCCNQFS